MLVASFVAQACDNPRLISHPSSPNQYYPTEYQWQTGLGMAILGAYGNTSLPGQYCVRYPDGIVEEVSLARTMQFIVGIPVPGTRKLPQTADNGGGTGTPNCGAPTAVGHWAYYAARVYDTEVGIWEFVVDYWEYGPGCGP